jgi:hypothetical protein
MLDGTYRCRLRAYPLLLLLASGIPAVAGGFGLWVEVPAAETAAANQGAALLVRAEDCRGPAASPSVSARAEGLVKGHRWSVPLRLKPVATDDRGFTVYGVKRQWPAEGAWLLTFTGKSPGNAPSDSPSTQTCRVMVELGPKGSIPSKSLVVRHNFGEAGEIESTLQRLARQEAAGTAVSRSSR